MKKLFNFFFKKQVLVLWHPDSPGVHLTVRRNWFQRKLYPRHFATLSEGLQVYREQARQWEEEHICGC